MVNRQIDKLADRQIQERRKECERGRTKMCPGGGGGVIEVT